MSKSKVLHIIPHLYGEPCETLKEYIRLDTKFSHTIATYDKYPAAVEKYFCQFGVTIVFIACQDIVRYLIPSNDIVILHWWNHPGVQNLLVSSKLPACRLIIWSHVSGITPSSTITFDLEQYGDEFILSSPISNRLTAEHRNVVWSTPGTQIKRTTMERVGTKTVVGYCGDLSYGKVCNNFYKLCLDILVEVPNTQICVRASTGEYAEYLAAKIKKDRINKSIIFSSVDIETFLSNIDILIHPLCKDHLGTTEHVLGKAMLLGIPILAFDNSAEQCIIAGECGILETLKHSWIPDIYTYCMAKNPSEFINKLIRLSKLKEHPKTQTLQAYANKLYDSNRMVKALNERVVVNLDKDRTIKLWPRQSKTPSVIFLESLPNDLRIAFRHFIQSKRAREPLSSEIQQIFGHSTCWLSRKCGTAIHYKSYFKHSDTALDLIAEIQEKAITSNNGVINSGLGN